MKMVNTLKRLISIFAIFATSLPVLSYSATQSSYPTKGIPVAGDKALITDSADGNKTKQATVGSFPISTATQTALDGKETKAVVQASAPADTTVDWYDTDQESGVLVLKRHNGTTWVRASSHGVQYLSNCAGITAGMCVDTDDGKLYYHNNTSVVEVGTSGENYTLPTASADILGGIKVGSRLSIADGVLSADIQTTDISGKEDSLGNPSTNGYVLSSTTSGVRSWIEMTGGGTGIAHAASDGNYYASKDGGWASLSGVFAAPLGADDNYVTDAEKTKLSGIASGAEVNVNADWNASSGDAQILNKPTIPSFPTCTNDEDIMEWDTTTSAWVCRTLDRLIAGTGITITENGGGPGVDTVNVTPNTYQTYDADWLGVTANGASLISAANYAAMRALLDLEVGTDFNAYDPNMISWPSAISATEVEYLDGVTSSIQAQIDSKQNSLSFTTTGLTAGHPYYMASGGLLTDADANGTGTYPARCIAVSTTTCKSTGFYTVTSHGLTVGSTIWLSTTAGAYTTTQPSTSGDKIQSLGWVVDSNTLFITVSPDYATVQ